MRTKSFLIFVFGMLTFTICPAQKTLTGLRDYDLVPSRYSAISIPTTFTYNNAPYIVLQRYEDDSKSILIYNENLEVVKTVNQNFRKTFETQITYRDEAREIESVSIKSEMPSTSGQYNSYQDFLQQNLVLDPALTEKDFIVTVEENGDSLINVDFTKSWHFSSDVYFCYNYFGKQYPRMYWRCKNGKVTQYMVTYEVNYTDWHSAGTHTETLQREQEIIPLTYVNLNLQQTAAMCNFELTQTLFNEDEGFEYIVPKYTMVNPKSFTSVYDEVVMPGGVIDNGFYTDIDIELTRSFPNTENTEVALAGFQVLSENGSVIKDLDFDYAIQRDINKAVIITIGSSTYLAFDGYNDMVFYKIERGTTNIKRVNIPPSRMLITPAIAKKNVPINIILDDDNKNGSDISVYSSSGIKMSQVNVPANQKQAQIIFNGGSGVYNLVRSERNKVSETKKFILK